MYNKKYFGNITLEEIGEKIVKSKNIILTAHVNPDGDALGSVLAFWHMINKYNEKYIINRDDYINCSIVIDDKLPKYMSKFEDSRIIKRVEDIKEVEKYDLFISLDCANESRYGNSVLFKYKSTESINIDHHISNDEHAQYNYVENISSTSELIFSFLDIFNIEITKEIGDYLYLGIINDTGNFRHDNVTENTFKVCSEIVKAGTNNHKIANIIFEISENKINILGDVYKNKVDNKKYKFKHYYLPQRKIKEYNLTKDDVDGIAEILLKIEGTELSLFLREEESGEIKGSFRANDLYDVNKMAQLFNGGGHVKAAGFKTNLSYEEIVEKVYNYLEK